MYPWCACMCICMGRGINDVGEMNTGKQSAGCLGNPCPTGVHECVGASTKRDKVRVALAIQPWAASALAHTTMTLSPSLQGSKCLAPTMLESKMGSDKWPT